MADRVLSAALVSDEAARNRALEAMLRGRAARRGYAIALDLLRDRAEAEDAVQEALARACREYERLRDPLALESWFLRVLVHHCLRAQRRRRLFSWFIPERADDGPAPDDALAQERQLHGVRAAVATLAPMQRTALTLRYGHELAVPEIAELMGIGAGTVKTHLSRGLERLREKLEHP
jgi:RNA polymerase sigma-70 factor (ECF subfamily)